MTAEEIVKKLKTTHSRTKSADKCYVFEPYDEDQKEIIQQLRAKLIAKGFTCVVKEDMHYILIQWNQQ